MSANQSVLERDYVRFWRFAKLVFRAGNAAWDADRALDVAIIAEKRSLSDVGASTKAYYRCVHTRRRRDQLCAAFEREFPRQSRLILRKW